MEFSETEARRIIEAHGLKPSTINVWRNRGRIPDRYANPDYQAVPPCKDLQPLIQRLKPAWDYKPEPLANFRAICISLGFDYTLFSGMMAEKTKRVKVEDVRQVIAAVKKVAAEIRNAFGEKGVSLKKLKDLIENPFVKYYSVCNGDKNRAERIRWAAENGNGLDKDDEAWVKDKLMLAYLVLNI